ncbi:MAG: ParB/RepB/Spo0J family partition protein, partial [Candidatus Colwellbacteria bacterium]|nr:ParB/RepB/Spo0J family partition protein [Candidatus Colwellbacteria bacterium]
YELIAGERRLMASKLLGLYTVPVIIRKPSLEREKLELAVIENVQRADLNPIETARAFAKLQDEFKLTQREIAAKLGKSREAISNSVRLLGLPSEIQAALAEGKLSESQARLLLGVPDIGKQKKIFDEIMRDNLSVRAIRLRVKGLSSAEMPEVAEIAVSMNPALTALKERLEEFFGTNIDLDQRGVGGKITINFYSPEELSVIVEKLLKQSDNQSPQSL